MREPLPEDWKQIEAALGFPLDPSHRERICRTLSLILTPRVGLCQEDARAFAILKRDAARLYFDLRPDARAELAKHPHVSWRHVPAEEVLTDRERERLAYLGARILPPEKLNVLLEGLAALIMTVDKWTMPSPFENARSGRPGRPLDFHFRVLIIELSKIYTEWSGRQPGVWTRQGPFLRFVKACLQAFAPELMKGDVALATAIKRTLSNKTPLNYTLKVKT